MGDRSHEMSDAVRAEIWSQVMRERCGADAELARLARQLPGDGHSFLAVAADALRALVGGAFARTTVEVRRSA
jgi:hypothetical protein